MSQQFWSDAWYQGRWWLLLLLPLSGLFRVLAQWRRRNQQATVKPFSAPVVVVGNISLGGTGKTPLLISLVKAMQARGFRPGIVSRGYGGSAPSYPFVVTSLTPPEQSGDEPLLIALETGCPVVVDPKRSSAVDHLISHFNCDLVFSDDGLQHYSLHRDIEICVIDGERGIGNGHCLPAGPLRESPNRLTEVDWIVVNGNKKPFLGVNVSEDMLFSMRVQPSQWCNLATGSRHAVQAHENTFHNPIHAVSGIGNPERFFTTLSQMGLDAQQHVFPDHHAYSEEDLSFAGQGTILMTTKDAVKCQHFAKSNWWSLSVTAQLPDQFYDQLAAKVRAQDSGLQAE